MQGVCLLVLSNTDWTWQTQLWHGQKQTDHSRATFLHSVRIWLLCLEIILFHRLHLTSNSHCDYDLCNGQARYQKIILFLFHLTFQLFCSNMPCYWHPCNYTGDMRRANRSVWHDNCGRPRACVENFINYWGFPSLALYTFDRPQLSCPWTIAQNVCHE